MTRILVIDDDRGILRLIERTLQKEGYDVTTVEDPEKLEMDHLNQYQLILLDVMMPGIDGFTLCEKIRDKVDCPILFVTAKSEERDLMVGLGVGGDDISLQAKQIFCKGQRISLTKSEYAICEYLALNRGQVFSKEQIYEHVFGYDGEADSSAITEHIKNIRAKFQKMEVSPVETVWGIGYRWK